MWTMCLPLLLSPAMFYLKKKNALAFKKIQTIRHLDVSKTPKWIFIEFRKYVSVFSDLILNQHLTSLTRTTALGEGRPPQSSSFPHIYSSDLHPKQNPLYFRVADRGSR